MNIMKIAIVMLAMIAVATSMKLVETRMMKIDIDNSPVPIEPQSSDKECTDCVCLYIFFFFI